MKLRIFMAAAALSLGLAHAAEPEQRPRITWVMAVPPPIHITGADNPPGYADETRDWFIAHMPGFQHELVNANSKRLWEMLAAADGICGAAVFKTPERAADTQFSVPVYWTLPNQLIVSAERAAALDAHLTTSGEVDLPALLADRAFVGGLQFGRSYSPAIDQALANAERRPGEGTGLVSIRGPGHFDMLASGRFDWTIGFPIEVSWWARRLEGNPEKTSFLSELGGTDLTYRTRPIAGSTGLVPGYIACSKRPVGLAAIAAIDRLVEAAGPVPPWVAYYLKWLDAGTRRDYLKLRETAAR